MMPRPNKKTDSSYRIPANLLQPLWLRSRESLVDNGLVYDPIAAQACQRCYLAAECLSGNVDQKQLLHATLTQLCDAQVLLFLQQYPDAWVINVGAGLDTRFYRIDNGRCHWLELDVTENLVWRQKLFHKNERYQLSCGSVNDLSWLDRLNIPEQAPVMLLCEQALLDCSEKQVANFVQALGRHFVQAHACLVLAGDQTSSRIGQGLGSSDYQHGFSSPSEKVLNWLPWAQWVRQFSPLDKNCSRWKFWQRWLCRFPSLKQRLTPVLIQLRW